MPSRSQLDPNGDCKWYSTLQWRHNERACVSNHQLSMRWRHHEVLVLFHEQTRWLLQNRKVFHIFLGYWKLHFAEQTSSLKMTDQISRHLPAWSCLPAWNRLTHSLAKFDVLFAWTPCWKKKSFEFPVIWDAITLMWCWCKAKYDAWSLKC